MPALLGTMKRATGLQRQVLSLWKRSLKMIQSKPLDSRPAWYAFVTHQFRSAELGGGVRPRDVGTVEFYVRKGEKMLEMYSHQGVKNVVPPEGVQDLYALGPVAKGRVGSAAATSQAAAGSSETASRASAASSSPLP